MEKDLEMELYKEYLNGKKEAFELLYTKYKRRIEYFVFNIVKDNEKAEDITQEVFMEIMQKEIKNGYNFKYHIFLLAKSKSLNYIKLEKRRNEINEKYIYHTQEKIEKDTLEIITKEESKNEIIEAINMLEDKYRNAVYLVKIEELSYNETAEILGETLQNTKNLVYRGKKELRKKLIQKGFGEMNKVSKVVIVLICVCVLLSGIAYAAAKIVRKINKNDNVVFTPSYLSELDEHTSNNIWVGTFELAWKELAQKVGKEGKIELEETVQIANELNQSDFSKKMLSEDDYIISVSENNYLGYNIYSSLNKDLTFIYSFDNFSDFYNKTFGDSDEYIKYFGINSGTSEKANENIEVLFYNSSEENFAVKLKTKEEDEIILYRTNDKKTFDEYYEDIKIKTNEYMGEKTFGKYDEILVPYISVNGRISYDELQGKFIKNTNGMYIIAAEQDVCFNLTEKGCNLESEATFITGTYVDEEFRDFEYDDTFIIFMREKDVDSPYFALKVDNSDILKKKEEYYDTQY